MSHALTRDQHGAARQGPLHRHLCHGAGPVPNVPEDLSVHPEPICSKRSTPPEDRTPGRRPIRSRSLREAENYLTNGVGSVSGRRSRPKTWPVPERDAPRRFRPPVWNPLRIRLPGGQPCDQTAAMPRFSRPLEVVRVSQSGYNLARMRFEILLAPEAVEDLRNLKASVRAEVRGAIEKHLRHEPEKESRSRIKRLSGLSQPQYRLRIGQVRVFYDVLRPQVQVLAIVSKEEATKWLSEAGKRE